MAILLQNSSLVLSTYTSIHICVYNKFAYIYLLIYYFHCFTLFINVIVVPLTFTLTDILLRALVSLNVFKGCYICFG